jgi:hypothetical protein
MLSQSPGHIEGWSANYEHFMSSTIYYFAQYFCWTRLLQQQLGYELFRSTEEMSSFFENIANVSNTMTEFPFNTQEKIGGEDRQIFALQQRALGELLFDNASAGERLMTYREFLDKWLDRGVKFQRHVEPVESFLRGVSPTNDVRWRRLESLSEKLGAFSEECTWVLQPTGFVE